MHMPMTYAWNVMRAMSLRAGGISSVPITVHPPRGEGGWRVTARETLLGTAYSDGDLIELLRRLGIEVAEQFVDTDSALLDWRGLPHNYGWGVGVAGSPPPPER